MPFNGSGVFQRVRNWVADAAAGIKIRADYHDAEDDGIAAGLSNCITRDGQSIVTQNIPFNSKRITGLADPINPQDAATKAYSDLKMPLSGGSITGALTVSGQVNGGSINSSGGAYYFRNDGNKYLTYDGTNFVLGGANFVVGSGLTVNGEMIAAQNYLRFGAAGGPRYIQWDGANYGLGGAGTIWHTGNFNPASYQPGLGFTPVRQGGGSYMGTNTIYIGWDGPANKLRAQVDGSELGFISFADSASAVSDIRLVYAGDRSVPDMPFQAYTELYTGGVMTGWMWIYISGGNAVIGGVRLRYLQKYTNNWYTVGYA